MLETILDLQKRGQLPQLIKQLRRLLRKQLSPAERADAQHHLGTALTDKGQYAEGLRSLQSAQMLFEELRQPGKVALCLAEQALNYHRRAGDREQHKALELLKEAQQLLGNVELPGQSNQQETLAKVTFYFAVVYSYTGDWQAAYHFYQDAYDLYQDKPFELTKVYNSLGRYYASLGRPTQARLYYERCIAIKRETEDLFGLAMTLNNLGRLHVDRGMYRDAQDCFQEALTLCQRIHNQHGLAINLNELGRVSLHLHEIEQARILLTRCLTCCGHKYAKTRGLAHKNLAKACLLEGKPQDGLDHITQSLNLFQRLKYDEGKGIAKRMQGRLLTALQAYRKAQRTFRTAITLFHEIQNAHEVAVTLIDLAQTEEMLGEGEQAFETLRQALLLAEGLHDDFVVQQVQDALHRISPFEALKIAIQRQFGKETVALNASLQGHQEQVTVLFSDIQGFTHFSAQTPARDVVDTLNDYFWEMTRVVTDYQGQVDKFIGDGLMVIFRGSSQGHHPHRAVSSGLTMLNRLQELNRERKRLGLWELRIRIGIHTGEAVIGNIGSYEKMDYTAIGSTVNLAQRLESHARINTVLISKTTYQQISGHFRCFRRLPFVPKGFQEDVENWEVQSPRNLVRFTPVFIRNGQTVEPQSGLINLSTLNQVSSDDLHELQDTGEHGCLASQVYRHPHLVLDDKKDLPVEQIKIALPLPLDFDLLVAAYFTQQVLEHGVLPVGARELSLYAKQAVCGSLPKNETLWNTPYGVLLGIFEKDQRYCEAKNLSEEDSNKYRLQRGFYLIEYLCLRVAEGFSLYDENLFEEEYPFERERKLIQTEHIISP